MRRLSNWAKANRWPARIIIILAHLLLVAAAIYIGNNLRSISVFISPVFNGFAITLYLVAAVYYPRKKAGTRSRWISHYAYQKSCDFILTFTGLLMICFLSNRPVNAITGNSLKATFPQSQNQLPLLSNSSHREKAPTHFQFSKRERKTLVKALRTELKLAFKGKTSAGKVALIILSALVAIALFLLVAGLSCNLSCSGNEGAAALVLILGTFAVIALLIVALKGINRMYRRRAEQKEQQPSVRSAA